MIVLIPACSTTNKAGQPRIAPLTPDEQKNISVKIILTSGLTKKNDPMNDVAEFSVGQKMTTYLKWFDVTPWRKYEVKYKWYGPDGEQFEQDDVTFKSWSSVYYTWAELDLATGIAKKGKWKVAVYLNDFLMKESSFTVY